MRGNKVTFVALILLIISLFSLDWLNYLGLIPRQVTWLMDIILIFLFFKEFVPKIFRREFKLTFVDLIVLSLTLVFFVSAALNSVGLTSLILSFRLYFRYVLLFYAVFYSKLDKRQIKSLFILFFILLSWQIFIVIFQFLVYGHRFDNLGGTLGRGTTGILAVLITVSVPLLFSLSFIKKNFSLMLLGFALFIPLMMNETKASFILWPIMALFALFHPPKKTAKQIIAFILLFLLFFGIGIYVYNSTTGDKIQDFFLSTSKFISYGNMPASMSKEILREEGKEIIEKGELKEFVSYSEYDEHSMGRLNAIKLSLKFISNKSAYFFGFGPNSASDSFFGAYKGELFVRYGGISGIGFTLVLLELGFFGLIILFLLVLKIYKLTYDFAKKEEDYFFKAVGFGFLNSCIIYFLAFFYIDLRLDILAFFFWFCSAVIIKLKYEQDMQGEEVEHGKK